MPGRSPWAAAHPAILRRARLPGAAPLLVRSPGGVALTFDDGPVAGPTDDLLDALADLGAPATFFVLADRVAADPALTRRIAEAGHRVELHGDRHARVDRTRPTALAARLVAAADVVEGATGRRPCWFRPPFGRTSWWSLRAAASAGLGVALWSVDPRDWEQPGIDALVGRLEAGVTDPDALVLLHDGDAVATHDTAVALQRLVGHPVWATATLLPDRVES